MSESEDENEIDTICEGCDDINCIHCIFKQEVLENKIKDKSITCILNLRDKAYEMGYTLCTSCTSVDVENFVYKIK